MASLQDIKRRIQSVNSTAKITNAMKLVSAAKFARASHAVQASRPYSRAFEAMVKGLVATGIDNTSSSLLRDSEPFGRSLIVIVSTDRGLCGALNNNIFKLAERWLNEQAQAGRVVDIFPWGRRAKGFANKRQETALEAKEKVLEKVNYERASSWAEELIEHFAARYDRIFLAYSEFESALTQRPVLNPLLPVIMPKDSGDGGAAAEAEVGATDFVVEPALDMLLDGLLAKRVAIKVFQALLEGAASEHGARMSAMDAATRNAKEVNRKLKIDYNRARQAAITNELIEIISGANAL